MRKKKSKKEKEQTRARRNNGEAKPIMREFFSFFNNFIP